MFPTLSIGGAVIPTVPLVYLLGTYLLFELVEKIAQRLGQDGANWYSVVLNGVVAGLISARLAFVLQHLPAFRRQPISIIWPLTAGYLPWVGLLVGMAVLLWRLWVLKLSVWRGLDVLAPAAIMGFGVVALADFLGGSGRGEKTAVFFTITHANISRHPIQLYELLITLLALLTWWQLSKKQTQSINQIGLITIATYSTGRLLIDAFRANAPLIGNGFHLTQIIALLILLTSLATLHFFSHRN